MSKKKQPPPLVRHIPKKQASLYEDEEEKSEPEPEPEPEPPIVKKKPKKVKEVKEVNEVKDDEKKPKKKRPIEYFDEFEVKALLDAPYVTSVEHRLILRFLVSTGVRVSEMLHTTWKDLKLIPNFESIRIRTLKKKTPTWRTVPLLDRTLVNMLKTRLEIAGGDEADQDELIFSGRSRQSVTKIVKTYTKRAGIKKRGYSHILRHSFAVNRLKNGAKLVTIKRLLGHSRISETEKYLQFTDYDIRNDCIDARLPWE